MVIIVPQLTLYGEAEFSLLFGAWPKHATFLPIMVGISLATSVAATGFVGGALGHSVISARDFEAHLQLTLESTSASLASLQPQLTSLAQVALQNRRALDLLMDEKGGTCFFLQEECCYYVNESGIVKQNVKKLTDLAEDLLKGPTKTPLSNLLGSLHLAPAFFGPFAHAYFSLHPPTLFTTVSQLSGEQNL
jgi:hypothetical protein